MRMILSFIIIFLSLLKAIKGDQVVMTNNGPVQGVTVESDGSLLEAYLGIPYAEPPIGRLRFSKPVPKTPWLGVYDASKLPAPCIQNVTRSVYYAPDISNMSEDCLYLNVWAPHSRSPSKLKPVLFFIHGGAFNLGSSNQRVYDGSKLAVRGDVIVVTVNYRVGAMGFFCAFIDDADGNMGLYDQVMALKWVKDNIAAFHGDPEHIVLIGQSAGAMSAAGHILSPLTKNMIKRVILQSGAAMLPMILDENARLLKTSQKLANEVGCADKTVNIENNPRLIVNCLKHLPAHDLSRAEGILMATNPITFIPRTGDKYIPRNTIEMIRNGEFVDTEMLIGVNKNEGTFFLSTAIPDYFGFYGINPVQTISRRAAYQITRLVYKTLGTPDEKQIAEFYVNTVENGTSAKYTDAMSESIGDFMITCNSIFHSEFHSLRNPVYFYLFSHRPDSSPLANWMGITHYDEVQYVFGNPLFDNFTKEEEIVSNRIMKRWLAFAKTGNPNIKGEVKWPLYSYENPRYLDINVKEAVRIRPDNYRCEFWRDRYLADIDSNVVEKFRSVAVRYTTNIIYVIVPVIVLMLHRHL